MVQSVNSSKFESSMQNEVTTQWESLSGKFLCTGRENFYFPKKENRFLHEYALTLQLTPSGSLHANIKIYEPIYPKANLDHLLSSYHFGRGDIYQFFAKPYFYERHQVLVSLSFVIT